MVTRSRLAGAVLVVIGAIAVTVGIALFSVPAAVVLAGFLITAVGLSLVIEVRP
jgi:energy-converting hydrogenase Eha subunit E